MIKVPEFDKYLIYDSSGYVAGIDPKAPDEVKKEFEKYKEELKKGVKL